MHARAATEHASYLTLTLRACMQVYAALNAIGEVSWSINTPIYEVLMQAWEQRMQIGSMPPQDDQPLQSIPASRMFAVQSTRWPKGQMIVSVSVRPRSDALSRPGDMQRQHSSPNRPLCCTLIGPRSVILHGHVISASIHRGWHLMTVYSLCAALHDGDAL